MTWTGRWLFSGRVLSGRAGRSEDKKTGKFGMGRSCTSYISCQASWLRSTASDVRSPVLLKDNSGAGRAIAPQGRKSWVLGILNHSSPKALAPGH